MLDEESTFVKLETNRIYAWAQCHPRTAVYIFIVGALNIVLNLADLFISG